MLRAFASRVSRPELDLDAARQIERSYRVTYLLIALVLGIFTSRVLALADDELRAVVCTLLVGLFAATLYILAIRKDYWLKTTWSLLGARCRRCRSCPSSAACYRQGQQCSAELRSARSNSFCATMTAAGAFGAVASAPTSWASSGLAVNGGPPTITPIAGLRD